MNNDFIGNSHAHRLNVHSIQHQIGPCKGTGYALRRSFGHATLRALADLNRTITCFAFLVATVGVKRLFRKTGQYNSASADILGAIVESGLSVWICDRFHVGATRTTDFDLHSCPSDTRAIAINHSYRRFAVFLALARRIETNEHYQE